MELKHAFFDTGEVRLHYVEGPRSGPPMVLLHGASGDWQGWNAVLPALTENWHVYSLDLRGHGDSGRAGDADGYHVSYFVADVTRFLREVVKEKVLLVGHSWGGVVALLCASFARDVLRGLVLVDPALIVRRPNNESKPYIDYFSLVYQTLQTNNSLEGMIAALQDMGPDGLPPEIAEPWAKRLLKVDANFLQIAIAGSEIVKNVDFENMIRKISCPIVLLQADPAKGGVLVQPEIDLIQANTGDVRIFPFPDVGHLIQDERPVELVEITNRVFS